MWINGGTQISQVSLTLMQSLYSMYTLPVMLPDTHPPDPAPGNTLPLPVTPPSPFGSQVTGQLHPWGSSGWSQSASHTCQSESSLEKDQRFKKKWDLDAPEPHICIHMLHHSTWILQAAITVELPSLSVRTSIRPLNMAFSMVSCLVRVCMVV